MHDLEWLLCALLPDGSIYAVGLVSNSPAVAALTTIDPATGNETRVNPDVVAGGSTSTGDLSAVDDAAGLFWYLGDTSSGTTLEALNMTTGAPACSSVVSGIKEMGLVGLGQSLDFDPTTATLILSGVSAANQSEHAVYRAAAGSCEQAAAFEFVGTFGYAQYVPLLHASSFDPQGQRLFVQLSTDDGARAGVGVISLDPGGDGEMAVVLVPEGGEVSDSA